MKIGIDLRMEGENYGIGRYGLELARHLVEIDRNNQYFFFVRDLAHFARAGFEMHSNVHLVKADFRHYSWQEQIQFYLLLKKSDLDLVHFLNFNAPILYRKPFVVTIHDLVHHKLPGNKNSRLLHRLAYRAVMRHAVFKSKRIITVSNFSKSEITSAYKVSPDKISVIYEGATPLAVTDSEVNQTQQKFGINKPYFLFVGVMERKKNIINLTRAFDCLKEQFGLNIQMVLVGKADPFYPEVIEQAGQIKYRKDLIITGSVTEKEKYALYQGARAFVSASLHEGFGLPGVEAMSLGIPLIVANSPVFNEIYDNGAIYFDAHDPEDIAQKIHFLFTDDKYHQLIANNAYQRGQYFSWEKTARETLAVYNQA